MRHGSTNGWVRSDLVVIPAVVALEGGIEAFDQSAYPERRAVHLPFGTELIRLDQMGAASLVTRRNGAGEQRLVVGSHGLRICNSSGGIAVIQRVLAAQGFDPGAATAAWAPGPRPRSAPSARRAAFPNRSAIRGA
ncbi:MAG: hypothetical protein KDK01_04755 [Rhodobacteraceae bacterium]|nr:hypothetical protein [Paracoccaceae bacterium]